MRMRLSPPISQVPNRLGTSPSEVLERHRSGRAEGLVERITVLITESEGLFRQGLRLCLALHEDVQVIGEAAASSQALGIAEVFHPDILLLGVDMLKASGLEFLLELRTKSPRTKVLIFSSALEDTFIIEALQHGAMGYLLETATPNDLIKAIRAIRGGEIWAQRKVLTQLLAHMRQQLRALQGLPLELRETLTDREREIVNWVMQGMLNKEIATQLGISEKTVKAHLRNIFRKLKVSRRAQLSPVLSQISILGVKSENRLSEIQ
jgi:DNA-binding NarL/FixJ family response regulator